MKLQYNDDGWTHWINHDGSGPPKKGTIVQYIDAQGTLSRVYTVGFGTSIKHTTTEGSSYALQKRSTVGHKSVWYWLGDKPMFLDVVKYRIKKPKGLTLLEEILKYITTKIEQREEVYV